MPINLRNLTVLIVEDTVPMLRLIQAALEKLGVGDVHTARDGEAGYHRFLKIQPDIIITDWDMEPMSGIELAEKIRKDFASPNRFVPIIMITGFSAKQRIERARDIGVTEFVVKPFSVEILAKRISHVVNQPRDFVDAPGFSGPDRRRRDDSGYAGPRRRKDDGDSQ